jgi:hypothetical protein
MSLKKGTCEAATGTVGEGNLHLLWKRIIHYAIHKRLPLDPIISQLNVAHTPINFPNAFASFN